MIAVELAFSPAPERLAARPTHRGLLERLHTEGTLHAAGPWHDDSGALLVFKADRDAVEMIIASDPYYSTPGVTVVAVRGWRPVVGPPTP